MEKFLKRNSAKQCNPAGSDTPLMDTHHETDTDSDSAENYSHAKTSSDKNSRSYKQKIRNVWLRDKRFKEWLQEKGDCLFCKYCSCKLQSKLSGLSAHMQTKKHIAAAAPFSSNKQPMLQLNALNVSTSTKKAELLNALFVAAHTSILPVDHFIKMQKIAFCDSTIAAEVKLGRTKCSAIIKYTLAPYFQKRLLTDIGDNCFSLIIDEATDISVTKYIGIVIRYYSAQSKVIVNTFLKLAEVENSSAAGIVASIIKTLGETGLSVKNLIGIGTDNASVMTGGKGGVVALLQRYNPKIILIPCVCHSIQLAVSSASKFIPNEVEFLISESYNWFSKSPLRQQNYVKIFSAINDGLLPLKIVRSCETRWLSIEVAVKRIASQWLELKTHFGIASTVESCHKSKLLSSLFNDINLAYLEFLKPVLQQVQIVNKFFESNSIDPTKLFRELTLLISNLCILIISPCESFDPLSSPLEPFLTSVPQFYYNFEEYIKRKKEEHVIEIETEKSIRKTCQIFLCHLIEQLRRRLPNNINILQNIDFFSVENSLKALKPTIFSKFEKNEYSVEEITDLEMQWKKISLISWNNVESTVKLLS